MKSNAKTVRAYLEELPEDRSTVIETVRRVILDHLPAGYEEVMQFGMISYQVPLSVYPDTYNGQPVVYAALASQKHHMAVYLMSIYMDEKRAHDFEIKYRGSGKRYDAGKSCVRFKTLDDLPLDLIGEAVSAIPMKEFVAHVKSVHGRNKR